LEYLIHDRKHAEGLVSENQWTPKFVIRMMGDISSALAYMHEIGLTHNDVKVRHNLNILIILAWKYFDGQR
jgi:serine/threonine protein kinase